MVHCLNPDCQRPTSNSAGTKFCQSCGTKLLLAERYRALKLIGQGGFGRTLLAEDQYKPSKPHCVIKQFYPQGQNKAGRAAELFHQEAVRLEQLGKHPQIPELFAHFEQDSRQYIVQEFIDGQNLAEEMAETGTFREEQIRRFLSDLLPVLRFIQKGEVIHRDIKPENIIRRRSDGRLVLVDFGAAKYATGTALGKTETIIGSAGYAAPEQTFGQAVFASDIYSLGVTCIHLLTDIEPFNLYDAMESAFIWRHHLVNNPVSDQLDRILDKMTQSTVKQRYQSAEAVMQALGLKVGTQKPKMKPRPQSNCRVIQPPYPSVGRQSATPAPVPTPPSPANSPPPTPVQKPSQAISKSPPSVPFQYRKENFSKIPTSSPPAAPVPPQPSPAKAPSPPPSPLPFPPSSPWQNAQLDCTLTGHSGSVWSVSISPDGKTIASTGWLVIKLWDLSTGQELRTIGGGNWFSKLFRHLTCVSFSPDGKTIAASYWGPTVKLWDLNTGQVLRHMGHYSSEVRSVAISPDSKTIASGSHDKTIKLWNLSTGQELRTFKGHSCAVFSVAISPDGKTIVSGSKDNTIKVWNLSTGQELRTLKGHSDIVWSVAISPDGKTIVSGSKDNTIKVWNLSTGQELRTLKGHLGIVWSVAISPDGKTIASGSYDKSIMLWHLSTGQELCTLWGHLDTVQSVVFSPDGLTLVSGGGDNDGTIKIWRTR